LPFPDAHFDLVTASLVFSSILADGAAQVLLGEMLRATARGGVTAIYDFRIKKPWNHSVRAVSTKRLERWGAAPDGYRIAGPLLPALPFILRLPSPLKAFALRYLPRTHGLWIWRG
jgi:ubiquinone/menaquinone biosynthesis C-methylase UbiE